MKKILILLIAFFLENCTFGSEGNSLLEKQAIFSRLFSLYTSSDAFLSANIYFYDDQGDSVLSDFNVVSGSPSSEYSVKLDSGSRIQSIGFDFYLDPPSGPFSLGRHTDTTNTGSSADVNYASPFSMRSSETVTISSASNTELKQGSAYKYSTAASARARRGILRRVQLEPAAILFSGTVKGQSKTIPFLITVPSPSLAVNLTCKVNVPPAASATASLRFKHSAVFKDSGSQYLLASMHSSGSDGLLFQISPSVNTALYSIVLKNLTETDMFKDELCF